MKLGGPPHEILEKEKVLCPSSTAVDTLKTPQTPTSPLPQERELGKNKKERPKNELGSCGFP